MSVSDELESQIRLYQGSVYQISKETGIANATILPLLSGKRGLSMKAINTLAEFFGLELAPKAAKPGKAAKSAGGRSVHSPAPVEQVREAREGRQERRRRQDPVE